MPSSQIPLRIFRKSQKKSKNKIKTAVHCEPPFFLKAFPWGKVDYLRLAEEKTDEGRIQFIPQQPKKLLQGTVLTVPHKGETDCHAYFGMLAMTNQCHSERSEESVSNNKDFQKNKKMGG